MAGDVVLVPTGLAERMQRLRLRPVDGPPHVVVVREGDPYDGRAVCYHGTRRSGKTAAMMSWMEARQRRVDIPLVPTMQVLARGG